MNTSISTWLLAGALAASLAWNVKGWLSSPPAPVPLQCKSAPDLSGLDLSAEQTGALQSWSANSCEPSCRMDNEADAKLEELRRTLSDPAATPDALRALAAEVSRLRAHSLDECIDSILEVRRVLTRDQLGALMQCCNSPTSSKP